MLYNIVHVVPGFLQVKKEAVMYLTRAITGDSMKKFRENLRRM